jgi:hypothetical protein
MRAKLFGLAALCLLSVVRYANADTVVLTTSDASVVAAFGKSGQGWWSLDTHNILSNTNYVTGTSFNVSPGIDFSYRSFFTFDLNDPALHGQTIISATIRLQAFQGVGLNDGNLVSFLT